MMLNRLTRSLTGALFRARRVQCALLLLTVLIGSAGVMTGCKGTVRVGGGVFDVEFEIERKPGPDRGSPCGSMEYNGRTYTLYCDANGRLIYAHDRQSGRWFRVVKQDDALWLPSDFPAFEQDGVMYVLPPEPEVLELSAPANIPAIEVAEAWGASLDSRGKVSGTGIWMLNRRTGVIDLRICLDWSTGLPPMSRESLAFELLVVSDDTAGVMLHRVVGPQEDVIAYMNDLGAPLDALTIDGFGLVPTELMGDGWLTQLASLAN